MPLHEQMLTTRSTYRESLVEHLFLGALLPLYWKANPCRPIEVSKPMVDDAGYDLILEVPGIVRHVQLKGSFRTSRTRKQGLHVRLAEKSSGCVVWITYDSDFNLGPFYWFGDKPGEPLPDISGFPHAKTTRANAEGNKKVRPNVYKVPKTVFKKLNGIEDVCRRLFGESGCGGTTDTPGQDSDPRSAS